MHEGSAKGYQKIREIVKILKKELGKEVLVKGEVASTPLVHVRYHLIVPKGWSQNRMQNDHCGPVYCFEVPLACVFSTFYYHSECII